MIEAPLARTVAASAQAVAAEMGGPGVAAPGDADRFAAAMAAPPGDGAAGRPDALPLAPAPLPTEGPVAPPSLGQAILEGMDGARHQFDRTLTGIRTALEGASDHLSVRDMLSIQMQISTLTLQQDLMGKIVGKSTQNIDQLLKAQ